MRARLMFLVNGVLMKEGAPPVQNRAASPDAGGWSVTGIFPLAAGPNTLRLEHKSRFPYFEKLLLTPNPLPKGSPVPLSNIQVSRQYGINPAFLDQWVEELRRSKGAPHSALFAWYVFQAQHSLDEKSSAAGPRRPRSCLKVFTQNRRKNWPRDIRNCPMKPAANF